MNWKELQKRENRENVNFFEAIDFFDSTSNKCCALSGNYTIVLKYVQGRIRERLGLFLQCDTIETGLSTNLGFCQEQDDRKPISYLLRFISRMVKQKLKVTQHILLTPPVVKTHKGGIEYQESAKRFKENIKYII